MKDLIYELTPGEFLGLGALGALGYFKFHRLFFRQGAEAVALNGAVMHEDIGTVIPGDEAKTLESLNHFTVPVSFLVKSLS